MKRDLTGPGIDWDDCHRWLPLPQYSALECLLGALTLGEPKQFLMLHSYADETGSFHDPCKNFVGMGGLLAHSDRWLDFDKKWKAILAENGLREPFHMADFAGCREQFCRDPWQDERSRQRLFGCLLDATEAAGVIPIGAVVASDDFRSLTDEQRTFLGGKKADPYYVAFQQCTHSLAQASSLACWPPEPVSMVYARLRKFTGEGEALWYAIKEANPLYGNLSSYTPGEPAQYTPLQAADIWAYELGHHFGYILPNGQKWRYGFERFVEMARKQSPDGNFFSFFDRERLLGCLDRQ